MIDILLHGALGHMGLAVAELAAEDKGAQIVCGVDAMADSDARARFPLAFSLEDVFIKADVVVDFSVASAADELLDYCVEKKLPCVLCTTGLSEEQLEKVQEASKQIAILRSANMSLGINLISSILSEISPLLLSEGFDAEILEKHHNRKVDAPSGTAIALADAINASLEKPYAIVNDRTERREKRPKEEIGISAIRGGTIVGEHDVFFAGEDEVITLSHTATSRRVFAKGALAAAKFLVGKAPGMYSMKDLFASSK